MRKKGIKYFLTIIALCCSICYLLLRIFGIIDQHFHFVKTGKLVAYAASDDVYLNENQTIALIGSSFPVTYHNATTGLDIDLTAHVIGSTDTYLPSGHWGGYIPFNYRNTSSETAMSPYNYSSGVVYYVDFPAGFQFDTSNTNTFYNMRCNFPFTLSGLTHFEMPVFWSASRDANQVSRSNASLNTSLGLQTFNALARTGSTSLHAQATLKFSDNIPENQIACFSGFAIDFSNETPFSVSSVDCGFNACKIYPYDDGLTIDSFVDSFYIIIECPVISNYSDVTTTVARTTRSPYSGDYQATTAQYTYDLSPLETNQINQINIANENLNYVAGIFDGVNIIIQELNDIYNRMVANGEIPVNLLPADPVKWYETDVKQQIDYIIEGHTTATLPDISNQMSFIGSAYNFLMAETWIAVLGGLSLAVSVACWILFEGRK